LSQDRKLLVSNTQLAVAGEQFLQPWLHLLAIRAAIVEEFDEGHIAIRVAADRRLRVIEDFAPPLKEGLLRLVAGLALELFFGRSQCIDEHIGVLQKIVVYDAFDRSALLWSKLRGGRRAQRPVCEDDIAQHRQPYRRARQHAKSLHSKRAPISERQRRTTCR